MAMNLSRRWFLAAASSALTVRMPAHANPHPFAIALNNSLDMRVEAITNGVIFNFLELHEDSKTDIIDLSELRKTLFEKTDKVKHSLECLFTFARADSFDNDQNIFARLLKAEKTKLGLETQNQMLQQDDKIEAMLRSVGLDMETWHDWYNQYLADDGSGLHHPTGIIRYNTGGLSQFYMDSMECPAYPMPLQNAIKSLSVELQERYPVNVPFARCAVLRGIVDDESDDAFIHSLKRRLLFREVGFEVNSFVKELKPQRKDDLLPFQFDHFGGLVGNDIY